MDDRTLLMGMDLGDEISQLAVYDPELMEPVLMGQSEENPDALIETAVEFSGKEPIRGFLQAVKTGEKIINDGKEVDAVRVLAYFFKKVLALTRKRYPNEKIKLLVVTVTDMSKEFTDRIYEALALIGLDGDRVKITDHKRSYMYYVLYQKKELWAQDVGMFDYNGKRLIFEQLQIDREHEPALVGVKEVDYTDALAAGDEMTSISDIFENVFASALRNRFISSVFLTGEGFETEWADELFPKLAVGRRLFKGRNLYVSGAAYTAKEMVQDRFSDYVVVAPDMVTSRISMEVYEDGDTKEVQFTSAGLPWFEVDEELDLIPDGDAEMVLRAEHIFEGTKKEFFIDMTPVAGRLDRMCRIGMRLRFEDVSTAIITLRDKGFGEIAPGSDRVWEERISCL
ncbi:MAG: hypothetical protein K5639_00370 [Eubacterium sp.]|nr:hypothetical protein [Eubacterium sp.]